MVNLDLLIVSGVSAKFSIGQFTSFNWYMRDTSQPQNVENRDVSEFESEFESCQNMTISGKSEIRQIYRLVYVIFGLTICCMKLSFIVSVHHLPHRSKQIHFEWLFF